MPDTKDSATGRPIEEGDWNMAFLFPGEVAAARERNGLVLLPLAPLRPAYWRLSTGAPISYSLCTKPPV